MRRNLLSAVSVTALALAGPGTAIAHTAHGHHHHRAKAKGHHARFRFVHIGAATTGSPLIPSPAGTPPTSPTTLPAPENAGTVASYTNEILTLNLNGGSTVSGKLTDATRIECVKATPTAPTPTTTESFDQSQGDENGQGDEQSSGDMSQQGDHESGESQGDQGNGDGGGDSEGEEAQGTPEPPCDSSALVSGAVVRGAELRIGPNGTEFESITLVR